MSEIARLLVVPLPVKAPLVAPVTVMSPAVSVVGSALKVRVRDVVLTEFDVPPACTALEKVTSISEGTPVAGNTAVIIPVLAAFVAIAPATVKLLAATPVKVYPALAVSTIFAVYTVDASNVLATGAHAIVPVYCAVSIAVVTGVAPRTGATTQGIASRVIVVSGVAPVAGNTAVMVPVFAAFVAIASATVKLLAATPVRVYPALAVSTIFAVYTVDASNVLATGTHAIVPVYCVVSIAVVTGVAPRTGATTPGIASRVMVESVGVIVGLEQLITISAIMAIKNPIIFRFISFLLRFAPRSVRDKLKSVVFL